ncbi:hypothetical protein PO909_033229 [Leuciscus waleckii]
MLVHGPASGYYSLQRSGETGGVCEGTCCSISAPCISDSTQQSIIAYHPPAKNTRWKTGGAVETVFTDCSICGAGD